MSKRLIGGVNLLFGRSRRFAAAGPKLVALGDFARAQGIELVLCSGDYTALGTSREFALAREAVTPLMGAPFGYFNVPGNHDLYVGDVLREARFEASFGETLRTDRPEYAVEGGVWPWVRLVGEHLAVVGVNSARPNPLPWRSSGKIPAAQLAALGSILQDPRVHARFVFVITHYAPCLEQGLSDTHTHGLVNAAALLDVCKTLRQGAILCGHVHRRFLARPVGCGVPVLCAGSATLEGRESFWVFDCRGDTVNAVPGGWDGHRYVLDESARVKL